MIVVVVVVLVVLVTDVIAVFAVVIITLVVVTFVERVLPPSSVVVVVVVVVVVQNAATTQSHDVHYNVVGGASGSSECHAEISRHAHVVRRYGNVGAVILPLPFTSHPDYDRIVVVSSIQWKWRRYHHGSGMGGGGEVMRRGTFAVIARPYHRFEVGVRRRRRDESILPPKSYPRQERAVTYPEGRRAPHVLDVHDHDDRRRRGGYVVNHPGRGQEGGGGGGRRGCRVTSDR
jgi:hypothetical protein